MITGIIAFIFITISILLIPFAKQFDWQKNYRRQTNIALYRRQIKCAPPKLAAELAQRLLQDEQYLRPAVAKSAVSFSKKTAILFSVLLIAAALGYYFSLNRIDDAFKGGAQSAARLEKSENSTALEKNNNAILNIQDKLRRDPNDGERWFELGQLYMLNNEFEYALTAYANAEGLLGSRADILSAAAGALYYKNKQTITGQVHMLIDAALEKDPKNTAALSLLASEAFLKTDYTQALNIWQRILDNGYTDVDRRAIIQNMQMAETLQKAKNAQ